MGSEWVAFREVAKLIHQGVNPEDVGDVPYIGLEHIEEGALRLVGVDNAKNVTSTKFQFNKGDILFGKLRPYFRKVIRAKFDGICSTDIWVVRPKEGFDQGYLFYWMASKDFVDFATQGSEGTKMPRAKWEHVGRFQRPRLEKPEQRAIAHILGTLDDKIELNRKMDETLEAMARAIFKAWFVDFEPVRAKMEGRWQRGQSLPGLPAHLYDLFPDRLVDSELGEIPEGWEVGKLSDLVIKVVDRVDPSPSTEAIPYVPIECIASRTILLSEWQPGINARSSLVDFKRGDILLGAMRPYFHKVCIAPFDGTTRTTAFVLRPANLEWAYAVFAISRDETIDYATAHSEGSTIPYAKWAGSLESLPVNIPPKELREYFHQRISPSVERMIGAVLESRTLAALRDILLPKLISGELRVPNAERCT